MQVCALPNKKPLSKQKKKRLKRNMSAVTPALILKKPQAPLRGFSFELYCLHLPWIETKNPDNLVRTMCSNSYGQNGFNFYLCPPVPDSTFRRARQKKAMSLSCKH
jgi:hypothetical protein